ncbi:MAG: NADH:ubiquinone reductase (Na(+)-transporting) subunit C [Planctomycetes bacterium]|nr:NADH:ubiquinone reductase (Na(+)-transporting) subunit C [Planctomycetota bacterium]
MDKNSNQFVVVFQAVVCVVLAVLLAATYNGLKDDIEANEAFDKQKNILKAVGLWDPRTQADKSRKELEALFANSVKADVLEVKRGIVEQQVKRAGKVEVDKVERVQDVVKTDIEYANLKEALRQESKKPKDQRRELVPFFTRVDDAGKPVGFCIPISGYGLWSTLYGYLALESDGNHVKGITFYKHGETPGLGGEVENPGWQASWADGKRVLDDSGNVVGVEVKKGGAPAGDPHAVDGLSGATITSDGVTKFVKHDLETYEPYLRKVRS